MSNAMIRKLLQGAPLSIKDEGKIVSGLNNEHSVGRRVDLTREGAHPSGIVTILDGFACRYKTLRGGVRQIVALMVPGDFCDVHAALFKRLDHSIATLSVCRVAYISRSSMDAWMSESPTIHAAVEWASSVDSSIAREWIVNLGARSAVERLAHFICELQTRLSAVGLTSNGTFSMPLTQEDLSQVLGLSYVHLNRTMSYLRSRGIIKIDSNVMQVLGKEELRELCDFNDAYLHLSGG